jgi:hypothetical protein
VEMDWESEWWGDWCEKWWKAFEMIGKVDD